MLLRSILLFSIVLEGAVAGIYEDSVKGIAHNKFDFIRIKVHYLQDDWELVKLAGSLQILQIMKNAMNKAIDIIQSTVKVERLLKPLLMSRPCKTLNESRYLKEYLGRPRKYCEKGCYEKVTCYNFTFPYSHLDDCYVKGKGSLSMKHGAGLNDTDLVVYAVIIPTGYFEEQDVIAGAFPCDYEPIAKDRPISGILALSTEVFGHYIRIQKPHGYDTYIFALTHELIHMLGFHGIAVPFFRDPETGSPQTPRSNKFPYLPKLGSVLTEYSVFDGSNSIYNPNPKILSIDKNGSKWKGINLVQAAAAYYNCSDLESVNIDYRTSHHMSNLLIGDSMSPIMDEALLPPGKISRLTAAFLKDTGWYKIEPSKVSTWQGSTSYLGCEFARNGCKNHKGWPCCSKTNSDIKCAREFTAKGVCLHLKPFTNQYLYRVQYLNETIRDDLWKYVAPFCKYPSWQPLEENNVLWEKVDKDAGYCFNYAPGRTKIDRSKLPSTLKAGLQQKYFDGNQQLSGCYKVNCDVPNGYNVSAAFGLPQFCSEDGKNFITFEHAGKKIGPFWCWKKSGIC